LEWRNGPFWLFEYAQVPGKWVVCQRTGWSMFYPAREPGRLRRRKISAGEAVKWLLIGNYTLADEREEFLEEVATQLEAERAHRGRSATR
jgi:hypothetical protein